MFKVNRDTITAIHAEFQKKENKFQNVRILLTGMGWSGPKFGLGLDEKKEDDYVEVINDVTFLMEQEYAELFDDITIAYSNGNFVVGITGAITTEC